MDNIDHVNFINKNTWKNEKTLQKNHLYCTLLEPLVDRQKERNKPQKHKQHSAVSTK